jgi:hypothetical protein
MTTGFACESVRDLVCDGCVALGVEGAVDAGALVHRGEKFTDGFEVAEAEGDPPEDSKE